MYVHIYLSFCLIKLQTRVVNVAGSFRPACCMQMFLVVGAIFGMRVGLRWVRLRSSSFIFQLLVELLQFSTIGISLFYYRFTMQTLYSVTRINYYLLFVNILIFILLIPKRILPRYTYSYTSIVNMTILIFFFHTQYTGVLTCKICTVQQ